MGNAGSSGNGAGVGIVRRRNSGRHQHHHHHPLPFGPSPATQPPQPQQPPEVSANRYVFAAATPYPPQYPGPNPPQYYQYGYYPPPPPAMPVPPFASFDHHHRGGGGVGPNGEYPTHHPGWVGGGRYPPYGPPPPPLTYVEHQKAVTIRNDINIKKETLRVEPDEQNAGRFLVAFTFDATVGGSITVFFFAKEGRFCDVTATKEDLLAPVTVSFKEGLGQRFRQPSGTGIDFSIFDEAELMKEGELGMYPLAVKAEASPSGNQGPVGENQKLETPNSQITQAVRGGPSSKSLLGFLVFPSPPPPPPPKASTRWFCRTMSTSSTPPRSSRKGGTSSSVSFNLPTPSSWMSSAKDASTLLRCLATPRLSWFVETARPCCASRLAGAQSSPKAALSGGRVTELGICSSSFPLADSVKLEIRGMSCRASLNFSN